MDTHVLAMGKHILELATPVALLVAVEVHARGVVHAFGAVLVALERARDASVLGGVVLESAHALALEVAAFANLEVDALFVELDAGAREEVSEAEQLS